MAFALPKAPTPKSLLSLLNVTIEALSFIAKLTKTVKDDQAVMALKAIKAAVATADAGYSGKLSSAEVRDQLAQLNKAILVNDAKAIDALKKKFGRT